jgi:hypothetical protein
MPEGLRRLSAILLARIAALPGGFLVGMHLPTGRQLSSSTVALMQLMAKMRTCALHREVCSWHKSDRNEHG